MRKLILILLVAISFLNAKATISQSTFKKLQKANKLIEKKQLSQAIEVLNPIANGELNAISKTYAMQSLANVYIEKNQYKKVLKYYEKILELNALKPEDLERIKFSLAQIYLSEEFYSKAIKTSKELLNSKVIKKSVLVENIALAYYYDRKYKSSIPYIKQVIKAKKKKENWYRMLYSSYIELKDYNSAISTLKHMVKQYSKQEEYWMQLISLYQTTKRYKKSLATLELAYDQNVVSKKKNIMYFVNILLQNNLYNKAGLLMTKGISKGILEDNKKNFNILISCFLNAKNYKEALPKLNNSKFANTDKYKLILGNIYFTNSDYKNTLRVLKNYKFTKNSKYDGQRYTLLALSSYELNDDKQTIKYLKKASLNKYEKKRAINLAKDLGYKI